jgi:hypothetical protein
VVIEDPKLIRIYAIIPRNIKLLMCHIGGVPIWGQRMRDEGQGVVSRGHSSFSPDLSSDDEMSKDTHPPPPPPPPLPLNSLDAPPSTSLPPPPPSPPPL